MSASAFYPVADLERNFDVVTMFWVLKAYQPMGRGAMLRKIVLLVFCVAEMIGFGAFAALKHLVVH